MVESQIERAVKEIDDYYGKGHARKNPKMVTAWMAMKAAEWMLVAGGH